MALTRDNYCLIHSSQKYAHSHRYNLKKRFISYRKARQASIDLQRPNETLAADRRSLLLFQTQEDCEHIHFGARSRSVSKMKFRPT